MNARKCDADLSVREVAADLGICEKTVRQLIKAGDILAYRFGKRAFRISREELASFKARRRLKLQTELLRPPLT